MHLFGYLYEDYHDARSLEHKTENILPASRFDPGFYQSALQSLYCLYRADSRSVPKFENFLFSCERHSAHTWPPVSYPQFWSVSDISQTTLRTCYEQNPQHLNYLLSALWNNLSTHRNTFSTFRSSFLCYWRKPKSRDSHSREDVHSWKF
jgi:hypothetical protein